MLEKDEIADCGRELMRRGLPRTYVARIVEELAEHQDDLEAEGLAAGLPPQDARLAAREKLGDMHALAEELLLARRLSYWWGRHPVVSFVLLPLPIFLLVFIGVLWIWAEASGLIKWSEHRESLPEPDWAAARIGFYAVLCMAFTSTTTYICYLTRRCCCGLKWAFVGCSLFFVLTLFLHTGFTPPLGPSPAHGNFWISFGVIAPTAPELIAWAVPLFFFILYCVASRRAQLTKTSN